MPQTWGDIASQLDANMPQAQYDSLRDKYFKDVVAPKIRPGFDPSATYKSFIEKTQRPSTISTADKFLIKAGQFTSAAVKSMVPGGGGEILTKQLDDSIQPIAEREGIASPTLEQVGSFVGQGIALEALLPAAGFVTSKVLPAAIEGGKAAVVAQKVARGGLAFATYDALEAKDGDRVAAGIKGAGIGAAGELALGGLFGFGKKAATLERETAHMLTKDAVTNEAPLPIQEAVSRGLAKDATEAKAAGMTKGPMDVTPSKRGLAVTLTDEKGQTTVIPIPKGKEDDIIPLIQQTLDMGGGFDAISASPRQMARAGRILRAFGDKSEAAAVDVKLPTPFQDLRGAVKQADFPDELSWKAYQAGEIRHQIREANANKAGPRQYSPDSPPVPDAGHRLLNDLARDIGQTFGLSNREEAGDQALAYFGKIKSSTGNIESVNEQLSKYAGTGKYDWTRGDMPQFGKEKINPEGGNLTSNLRDMKTPPESTHPFIPKGRGKEFLKPPPSEIPPMDLGAEGRLKDQPIGKTKIVPMTGDVGGVRNGTAVLSEDATRGTVYHERVHQGIVESGLEDGFEQRVPEDHSGTARDLAKGIRSKFLETYAGHDEPMMLNEAFTHAAEAVRVGNVGALDELGRMDTDVASVKKFVNGTAGNLWEASLARDTAPVRAFQRRMVDLARRTSEAPSLALREAETTGWRTWFDPELGQWVMRDGDGRTVLKKEVREVWDHLHDHDPSDQFPDGAHKSYFRGKFAPGTPGMSGPSAVSTSSPEIQTPELGWQSVRALFAPTEASASGVARKFAEVGQKEMGQRYYDAFKGALENEGLGRTWNFEQAKKYGAIMKGLSHEKLLDLGETLAHDEQQWAAMASQLKLSADDLARVRAFSEFDKKLAGEGGISPIETLKTLRAVRTANGDLSVAGNSNSPIAKALNSGALSWSDFNVGKITSWALRESVTEKFTKASLDEIDVLAKLRTPEGKLVFGPMQYSMQNFTRYMRNHRDQSQVLMDSLFNGMVGNVEKKGVAVGLKPGWTKAWGIGDSRSAMQMYLKVMATANLGGRPVSFIRDSVSGLLQLSVGGPKTFTEGVSRLMSKEGRVAGEKYLLNEADIAGYFGDTTGDLAQSKAVEAFNRFADLALTPTRLGNNMPRMIAGLGEESRALKQIAQYRAGKITADDLMNNTGAWFQDVAPRTRLIAIAGDSSIPVQKAAEAYGHAFVDATQFAMSKGAQGAAFRTGAGKLLGQYGTWPANYANFVRKLAARSLENPKNGVPALATFTGFSYGTLKAAQALSIDVNNWLFFSPIGYSGSPTLSLLQNALSAPEETQTGKDARAELIKSVSQSVIPLGTQFRSMMKAFQDDGSVNVPRLLGFKPLKEQDDDWVKWLKDESGLR